MESFTSDGITVTSSTDSAADIQAQLEGPTDPTPPAEPPASPEPTEKPAAEPEPGTKGSFQKRIDSLTTALANAKQGTSATNAQLAKIDVLERKLAALEARRPEPVASPPAAPADEEPTEDQFDSYRDYVKAQAKWEVAQALKSHERDQSTRALQAEAQASQGARLDKYYARLAEASAADPAFDQVLDSPVALSLPMQDVIIDSEIAPALMKHLAEHPDEAQAIYRQPTPILVFKAMSKLEARLESAVARGPAPVAPVSKAKAPIKPLGSTASKAASGAPDPDTCTQAEFDAWDWELGRPIGQR